MSEKAKTVKAAKAKDIRLAAAAKKLRELQEHGVPKAKYINAAELQIFKWLQFDAPERRALIDQYIKLIDQENQVTLVDIPKAQGRYDTESERFSQILAQTKLHPSTKEKKTKNLMKRITQSTDFLGHLQRILGKTLVVAQSPRLMMQKELVGCIELARINDTLQVLRRKLNENRDEKLNDVYGKELKASLKKYERLRAHVKESEGTLKEEFAKLKQLMGGVSIEDAVWDVVSEPVLRRLAFARLVMAEAANEHAVLIGEAKRIPSMRDKMQAEIATVANKQYRQLARLFHSDKGGSQERFEEIKYSQLIMTDVSHLGENTAGRPNLLYEYITRSNHDEFVKWMRLESSKAEQVQTSATQHAKKKVGGQYVADDAVKTRAKPKLMLEGGRPPKCKMPRGEYQKNDMGRQLPRLNGVCPVVLSWAPAHSLAEAFELYMGIGSASYKLTYSGNKDFYALGLAFPGEYRFKVRARNTHGFGEDSTEVTVALDDNGDLGSFRVIQIGKSPEEIAKHRRMIAKKTSQRELQRAVDRTELKIGGTLHAKDRPAVILELKQAFLAHRGNCEDDVLKTKARNMLVGLRRKELTREWRDELKKWTDTMLDEQMEEDEIEVEVYIRVGSLDPERLNWFYQHQLSRSKKVIEQYRGSLESMPVAERHIHRRIGRILGHILLLKQLKPKMEKEFSTMHKNLVGALDKSEDLEKQKDAEELARQKRSEQRSQNEIIRREERLKEEYIRITERNKERKAAAEKLRISEERVRADELLLAQAKAELEAMAQQGRDKQKEVKKQEQLTKKQLKKQQKKLEKQQAAAREEAEADRQAAQSTDAPAAAADLATKKLLGMLATQAATGTPPAAQLPAAQLPTASKVGRGKGGRGRGGSGRGRGRGSVGRVGGSSLPAGPVPPGIALPVAEPLFLPAAVSVPQQPVELFATDPSVASGGTPPPGLLFGVSAALDSVSAEPPGLSSFTKLAPGSRSPLLSRPMLPGSRSPLLSRPMPMPTRTTSGPPGLGGGLPSGLPQLPPGLGGLGGFMGPPSRPPPGISALASDLPGAGAKGEPCTDLDDWNLPSSLDELALGSDVGGGLGGDLNVNAAPWGTSPASAASNPAVGWGDSNSADASGWTGVSKSDSGWGAQSDAVKSSDANWSLGGVGAPIGSATLGGGGGTPPGLLAPGGSAGESAEGDGRLDPRVRKFLTDLKMDRYAPQFARNEIDWEALLMLEKDDLVNMGIDKTGPQLKIKRALVAAQESNTDSQAAAQESVGIDLLGSTWSDVNGTGGSSGW